jgi:hypothetical protein
MKAIINFIICLFQGHNVDFTEKTNNNRHIIKQVICKQCGKLFAFHPDHHDNLLPWSLVFEDNYRRREAEANK